MAEAIVNYISSGNVQKTRAYLAGGLRLRWVERDGPDVSDPRPQLRCGRHGLPPKINPTTMVY